MAARIALFVDGDNISPKHITTVMNGLKAMGKVVIKRVYGDFTKRELKNWNHICSVHDIDAHQVWSNNRKQATDMRIISDGAMLITASADSITHLAIVSGDQDFSHLVRVAHRYDKYVIGCSTNSQSTSSLLQESCDTFVHLDTQTPFSTPTTGSSTPTESHHIPIEIIAQNVGDIVRQCHGYDIINPGYIKEQLLKKQSTFKHQHYGVSSFTQLLQKMGYEIVRGNDNRTFYVRT